MTNLRKLRNYVGLTGDWSKYGVCTLPFLLSDLGFAKIYLVCEAGKSNVFESVFPDTTDTIGEITEARAEIILELLTKTKAVDLEKKLIS